MKIKILILFALLAFISNFSQAQLIKNSKASECVAQAKTFAIGEGYTDPQIVAIGTMAGDLNVGQLPLKLEINVTAGTGTAWLFVISSTAKPDSTLMCGVVKTALGTFMSVRMPGDQIPDMQVDLTSPLTPYKWMDSDKIYSFLAKNSDYTAYMKANSDAVARFLALGVMDVGTKQAAWALMLEAKAESMTCVVEAEKGETMCFSLPTSVNEDIASVVNVYPNPTADYIIINLPLEQQSNDSKMVLADYAGNILKDLNTPKFGETNLISLNTKELSNGVYFIRYNSSKGSFVKSFTVIK